MYICTFFSDANVKKSIKYSYDNESDTASDEYEKLETDNDDNDDNGTGESEVFKI